MEQFSHPLNVIKGTYDAIKRVILAAMKFPSGIEGSRTLPGLGSKNYSCHCTNVPPSLTACPEEFPHITDLEIVSE